MRYIQVMAEVKKEKKINFFFVCVRQPLQVNTTN